MKKTTKITILCALIGVKSVWAFQGTTPEMMEIVNDLDHPVTITFDGSNGAGASMMRGSFILWQPNFDANGNPVVDYSDGNYYEISAGKIILPAQSSTKSIGHSNGPIMQDASGKNIFLSKYLQYSRDVYITFVAQTDDEMRYGTMKVKINSGNEFYVGYSGLMREAGHNYSYFVGPVTANSYYTSYIDSDNSTYGFGTYYLKQPKWDTSADDKYAPTHNTFYVSRDICVGNNPAGIKKNRSSGDYINCLLNLNP